MGPVQNPRSEKDLGVSPRGCVQQKVSLRAQVTHLHKESKRFSILLFKDSELHTGWKEAEQRNQVQAGEKPMLFAVQLCWLSTDFLEMEFSTFLDLWTLTHFQQETQILSKMVLHVMTKDVFLLAPLKPALWLPGLKCSPEESTKPRNQPASTDDDRDCSNQSLFPNFHQNGDFMVTGGRDHL